MEIVKGVVDKIVNREPLDTFPIPLEILSSNDFYRLSEYLLGLARKADHREAVKRICQEINNRRERTDLLPAPTVFFLNNHMQTDLRKFVLSCFPTIDKQDHLLHVINMVDVGEAMRAVQTMQDDGFLQDDVDWPFVYSLTDDVDDIEYHNPQLREWIQTQLLKSQSKPLWIRDLPCSDVAEVPQLPSVMEASEMLVSYLQDKVKVTDAVRQGVISQYAIGRIQDKIDLLKEIAPHDDFDDTAIFHEYGPCNTQYTNNTDLLPRKCRKYGGCRMFLCTEFECEEEEDLCYAQSNPVTEWFTGQCGTCKRGIPKKHYAVREPLHHGGWKGCYCSILCLRKVPRCDKTLINTVQTQLEEIGIRER